MSSPKSPIRLIAFASLIGTTIEWYDFFLYDTAAALVFNKLFFPTFDPLVGHAGGVRHLRGRLRRAPDRRHRHRPLRRQGRPQVDAGAHADDHGRRDVAASACCRPTRPIGPWAAVLLVVLRLVQGFGVGGEWGGAVLMAVEHAPAGQRGFYGSWPQIGVPAGLLTSTIVFSLVLAAAAGPVPGVGLARAVPDEHPAGGRRPDDPAADPRDARVHEDEGDERAMSRQPIIEVLQTYPKEVLQAVGARCAENGVVLHLQRVHARLRDAARRTSIATSRSTGS